MPRGRARVWVVDDLVALGLNLGVSCGNRA